MKSNRKRCHDHHLYCPTHISSSYWWSMTSYLIYVIILVLPLVNSALGAVTVSRIGESVVETRYGKIKGVLTEFPNPNLKPIETYFGLRYAELDEGNMRFMPPKNPKEHWNGFNVKFNSKPACPQPVTHEKDNKMNLPDARVTHLRNITPHLINQTEDCLTLNMYVPKLGWNDTDTMAVMVFIHGEGYDIGSGSAYDGSVLASFGQVIVVTLDYRLGVLGFLSTEDKAAYGNYALLDITQALLWLRENIGAFFGDPQRITLFGHGTGAALINLFMLSPFVSEDKGQSSFFQRAILQSGSAESSWAVSYDPKWCVEKLAQKVNCSRYLGNSPELVSCLRRRPWQQLINNAPKAPKYYSCFAPSINEFAVLPKDVDTLLKARNSKFAKVPVMFGITKNEAYSYLKQQEIQKGISSDRKSQIIRTYVQNVFRYHRQKIYEILDHHYTDWTHSGDYIANRDSVLELLSDGQYVAPLMKMANAHAETAPTYLYSFAYSTQSSDDEDAPPTEGITGIHGDELPYVFGAPLVSGVKPFPYSYTSAERMLSEAVMTYWTNFAKTGDPNRPRAQTSVHGEKVSNRFEGLKWTRYTQDTQEYLQIGRRPSMRSHYRAQKLALWLDLIPKIHRDDSRDPSSHLLNNADNQSSFDDYNSLISSMMDLIPTPPPPIPPFGPSKPINDVTWSTHNDHHGYDDSGDVTDTSRDIGFPSGNDGHNRHGPSLMNGSHMNHPDLSTVNYGGGGDATVEAISTANSGDGDGGMPLSIVVAIGGCLLLINILIFAGLCFQRERIRKMRMPLTASPDVGFVDPRAQRKLESGRSSPGIESGPGGVVGPECVSLMSGASSAHPQGQGSETLMKGKDNGNTHVHHPSPQPSNHSSRGRSLTRATPPPYGSNCNYEPVPTYVTSPVHRGTGSGPMTSNAGNYVNSKVRGAPGDHVNHKDSLQRDGMPGGTSTFAPGPRVGAGERVRPISMGASVEDSASNSSSNPVYSTIKKSGQQNAVTIV